MGAKASGDPLKWVKSNDVETKNTPGFRNGMQDVEKKPENIFWCKYSRDCGWPRRPLPNAGRKK